jgi:RsiW-degrading membrane proteinase PrsW (M82 family)
VSSVRRWWFPIFVVGLALLFLAERVLVRTQDPLYISSIILLGSFLVPITFVTYLYGPLPAWDVPLPTVAACFVWGGTIGTIVAGSLEYDALRRIGLLPLLGVGLIEESAKLIFPLIFYFLGRYRSEADGIILGVSTAMGFAALETMGYSLVAFIQSQGDLGVLLVRGLMSPAGHGAWTGLVCAVLFRERLRAGHAVLNWRIAGAFLTAVVLHTLWDIFNSQSGPIFIDFVTILLSLVVAVVSLTLLIRRVHEASRTPLPTQ